jgi:AcrR family transcriptional regulator
LPSKTRSPKRGAKQPDAARKSAERAGKLAPAGVEPDVGARSRTSDRRLLKGQASRDRFLDSALELFSQRGYAATGISGIVRAAGIEKSALYWHFGSKEGLLAALFDRMDAEFVEGILNRAVGSEVSPEQGLDLFVDGLKQIVEQNGHVVRLLLSVSIERSQVSAETRAAMQRVFDRTRDAVAHGFEQALGVKLPDVDLIARLTLAYLWEASVRAQIDPKGVDHDRFFAHLRRLIALDVDHQLQRIGAQTARPRPRRRRRRDAYPAV